MKRATLMLAALALVFGGVGQARADYTIYSDSTSWGNAVSGVTTTNLPNQYTVPLSVTSDGVVFSPNTALGNGIFFSLGPIVGLGIATGEISDQDPSVGVANVLVTLPSSATAFAVPYSTQYGGSVTFALSNGNSVTVGSTDNQYGNLYGLQNFFGITDTNSFTSVQITTTDPVITIGNVSFGNAISTPEPSGIALLGISIVCLTVGYAAWRRKLVLAAA